MPPLRHPLTMDPFSWASGSRLGVLLDLDAHLGHSPKKRTAYRRASAEKWNREDLAASTSSVETIGKFRLAGGRSTIGDILFTISDRSSRSCKRLNLSSSYIVIFKCLMSNGSWSDGIVWDNKIICLLRALAEPS